MIDPSESLLAVVGMRPIISHEIEEITPQQWKRALGFDREIDGAARELVRGKPRPVKDVGHIDYFKTLRDLVTPWNQQQVEAMLAELPSWFSEYAGSFVIAAHRAFEFMGSQLPRQLKVELTGPKPLKPPERLVYRFLSLLEVLDDPIRALTLSSNAHLLGPQIQGLEQVFPTLVNYMREAIAREIRDARAEDATFRMHYYAEMGAEKLLGVDLSGPALRKMLQTPPAPQQPQQGATPGAAVPTQQMTRVQRTDNLDVG